MVRRMRHGRKDDIPVDLMSQGSMSGGPSLAAASEVCGRAWRHANWDIGAGQVSSRCSLARSVSAPHSPRGADVLPCSPMTSCVVSKSRFAMAYHAFDFSASGGPVDLGTSKQTADCFTQLMQLALTINSMSHVNHLC